MENVTLFSDKFLIKAATSYVYTMSNFKRYVNPIDIVIKNMNIDFPFMYTVEKYVAESFWRDGNLINLRYLLIKHSKSNEFAVIFQGSEDGIDKIFSGEDLDWSNNLSSAAHLKLENYKLAYAEYKYLKDVLGYNITSISGNSLGGAYALFVGSKESELRIIAVNPAPPQSGSTFINKGNSSIILTSTDLLSRLLKTDPKRSNYGDANALENIYGFKPILVQRSIPYNNELNVAAAHVGAINDTYDYIMYTYNKNSLFYNAKVIGSDKGSRFSKLLLSTMYKQLKHTEYDDFVRNSIYPNLFLSAKNVLETYKYYPSLSEFMAFDFDGNIISDLNERYVQNTNYAIDDKYMFTSKVKRAFNEVYQTQKFYIDNSMCSIIDTKMNEEVVGYTKPSFINDEIKLNLRFDWSIFKLIYDLPLSVKLKFKDILSNTLTDLVSLNNNLDTNYREKFMFSSEEVDSYVEHLYAALKTLDLLNEYLHISLDAFMYNIEQQIISGKKIFLFNVGHINLPEKELPSINHLYELETNMMKRCIESVESALKVDRNQIHQYFENNDNLIKNILNDLIIELKVRLKFKENEVDRKKLTQIEGLLKSINFEQLFSNASKEFELEFAHLILGDSKVVLVYYNLKQMLERNKEFEKFINELDVYIKYNFSPIQYKQYTADRMSVMSVIDEMNVILYKLIT